MTTVIETLRTIQARPFLKPMSKEQVIKVNTALLVFALSSLGGTIFWGGQIFEKLSRIEKEVQKMDHFSLSLGAFSRPVSKSQAK